MIRRSAGCFRSARLTSRLTSSSLLQSLVLDHDLRHLWTSRLRRPLSSPSPDRPESFLYRLPACPPTFSYGDRPRRDLPALPQSFFYGDPPLSSPSPDRPESF